MRFRREYCFLSNFYDCPIVYEDVVYPSVEYAYQAAKCRYKEDREKIRAAPVSQVKKLSRELPIRDNWKDMKVDVMYRLLCQKFAWGSPLAKKLMGTGTIPIVEENTWGDTFWGVCVKKHSGKNNLGRLLMEIREDLFLSEEKYEADIRYIIGDATYPEVKPAIIIHICNNTGGWGSGFVVSLSRRWREPEFAYRKESKELGTITWGEAEPGIYVANMVAQDGIGKNARVDLDALYQCLQKVLGVIIWIEKRRGEEGKFMAPISIHCPRIGTVRGHTSWSVIEPLLRKVFTNRFVYVYDLKKGE